MSNYIGNEKLLSDSQYAYRVSQSLSTEEYRDVQTDFISNPRASSCEPLPQITIRTPRDLQAVQDRLGNNFRVVVPLMFRED
uniref:Uncharacterized protein n=1 Tax=Salix viminalis TaxID=40686 RepID=A0A6N2N041_SALVM